MHAWTHRRYKQWLRQQRTGRLRSDEVSDEDVIRAIRSIPTHYTDITFRSFSQADQHNVTSTDPGKPSGAVSTDVLVAVYAVGAGNNNSFTLSAPSGWTAIHAQQTITNGTSEQICMRNWWALGNVSSTSFSHNAGAGRDSGIVILAFQNVDNGTPIDATGTASNNVNTGALTVNAVTTVTDRALEVVGLCDWQSLTFAMTNFTVEENGTPPPSNESAGAAYKTSVTTPAGSTGTASFTTSGESSGQIKIALPFALRPASVPTVTFPWAQTPDSPVRPRREWSFGVTLAPIVTTGENVLLDKWYTQPSEPYLKPKRTTEGQPYQEMLAGPYFGEVILLDKWWKQPSEPVRFRPEPAGTGTQVWHISTSGEYVLVDKWYTQPSEPVRFKPEPLRVGQSVWHISLLPESVLLDKWWQQPSEPVRTRPEAVRAGFAVWQISTLGETVLLDKWWVQPSEPVRSRAEPNRAGQAVWQISTLAETVLVDKWVAIQPDLMRLPKRPDGWLATPFVITTVPVFNPATGFPWPQPYEPARRTELARFGWSVWQVSTLAETVLLDKWYAQPSEPVKQKPEVARTGQSVWHISLLPETVLLDRWYVQPSEPVRSRPEPNRAGWFVWQISTLGEVVLIDKWWGQPSEPVKARPEPVRDGRSVWHISLIPETVLLDRWWTQPSEPVRLKPEAFHAGFYAWTIITPATVIPVFVDQWWRQPSEPVRARLAPVQVGATEKPVSLLGETILVDKWWTAPPDLIRRMRFDPQWQQDAAVIPPLVLLDKWAIGPEYPVRRRPDTAGIMTLVIQPPPVSFRSFWIGPGATVGIGVY